MNVSTNKQYDICIMVVRPNQVQIRCGLSDTHSELNKCVFSSRCTRGQFANTACQSIRMTNDSIRLGMNPLPISYASLVLNYSRRH